MGGMFSTDNMQFISKGKLVQVLIID